MGAVGAVCFRPWACVVIAGRGCQDGQVLSLGDGLARGSGVSMGVWTDWGGLRLSRVVDLDAAAEWGGVAGRFGHLHGGLEQSWELDQPAVGDGLLDLLWGPGGGWVQMMHTSRTASSQAMGLVRVKVVNGWSGCTGFSEGRLVGRGVRRRPRSRDTPGFCCLRLL
jgi:hypothetical protein